MRPSRAGPTAGPDRAAPDDASTHRDLTDWEPPYVWYAAYGSNLAWHRFRCYLEGGRPPGARSAQPGCRDPRPPLARAAVSLPHPLRFAGSSTVWGGGKAFVGRNPAPPGARAVAWLLRRPQFDDLLGQERRRTPVRLHVAELRRAGHLRLGPGDYDLVLDCGTLDGLPVVTFTEPSARPPRAPTPAYLRTLAAGLRAGHGMSVPEVVDYLAGAEGVGAGTAELRAALAPLADQQPDGPATAHVVDAFDGEELVPRAVDPPGEGRR